MGFAGPYQRLMATPDEQTLDSVAAVRQPLQSGWLRFL